MQNVLEQAPRHEMANPRNYTNLELERKSSLTKELHKRHPNVPQYWVEMLFDYLHGKSDEELEKMVNDDTHGEPAKNPRVPIPAEVGIEVTTSN